MMIKLSVKRTRAGGALLFASMISMAMAMSAVLNADAAFIAVDADVPNGADGTSDTARFVRTVEVAKPVKRVTWTVSGLGVFRIYVNGREAGADDFLKPGLTHIVKRRHSFSYDVTAMFKLGKNVLAAEVSQTQGGQYLDFGVYALPEPISFNLASFNIRVPCDTNEKAWTNRAPLCVKLIKRHGFDLMGVQEATPVQIKDLRDGLPGWNHVGLGREKENKGEATAIFFKTDRFELLGTDTFWLSETPTEPGSKSWDTACTRVCTWAYLRDKKSGKDFYFFNTHLDHISAEARIRGMALILERIKQIAQGKTVFLTGDMNAVVKDADVGSRELVKLAGPALTDNPSLNPIFLAKAVLLDSFDITETPHAGPVNTFTGYQNRSIAKIDYVFTTGNVRILSHKTCDDRFDKLHPSDHDAVVVKAVID